MKRVRRLLVQPEGPRAALTPVFSAAILTITVAAAMTAWQTSAPPRPPAPPAPPAASVPIVPPAPAPAQAPPAPSPVPPVTPYTKWVTEDVAYIITDDERNAFKRLQSDPEREHFIEQFWQRRDPTPATPENEFKEEHYRRIAYANQNYWHLNIPGWKTDRGRIYITYGPPDEKESHPSGGSYRRTPLEGGGTTSTLPFEQWLYRRIDGVGSNIVIEFVDPTMTGEYHMSVDPAEKDALLYVPPEDRPLANAAKAFLSVKLTREGEVSISVPLGAYGDHLVKVYGRVVSNVARAQAFEDSIQGPAEQYTKVFTLATGTHRFEIVVKDTVTGKLATDTMGLEVK